ncbi:MAG: adenylate cyclase [Halieaceae bacterium]|jgi:cytochrome c|nr:adenylate cyclase [Halieaceae bacterium]
MLARLLGLGLGLLVAAAGGQAQTDPVDELSLLQGDPARGRLVFAPCRACHFTEEAAGHGNGPNLSRIFGRVAGQQTGFEHYSDALKASQFVWTPQLMYTWLENPLGVLPGTTMMSAGVPDPSRRADLIAYLQSISVRQAPSVSR